MTVIVFKDGIMAADTAAWDDCSFVTEICKIVVDDNFVAASAGFAGSSENFLDYLNGKEKKDFSECYCLYFSKKEQKLFRIDQGRWTFPQEQPYAMGSGADLALGAMHAGKNAIETIEIAIKFHAFCDGNIIAYDCFNNNWIKEFSNKLFF